MTVAAINVAVYLTTIIFYIKGKSFRIWTSEKNFLSRAGLDWKSSVLMELRAVLC